MTPLRELQLLEAHRNGDPGAMGELMQSYQRRVFSVCYRMLGNPDEAADLTQDSLVKVLEGLDSYNGRSKLSTWVIRVAMNCCLSHLRREKIRKHCSLDDLVSTDSDGGGGVNLGNLLESGEPGASEHVQRAEVHSSLLKALNSLDPDSRALLILRDLNGLDYLQIGEVLDVPVGTVKSRLFRARAALREAAEYELGTDLDVSESSLGEGTGTG
ncbi:MAG: RNA polymerase sigma factor [Planctomycetota bacterium]|nr:RNA polymerase sigma factor [Planctomycetota bacterium]